MFPWTLDNIHLLFVHFPIALFSTGWVCDLIAASRKNHSAENAGWWCLLFGIVSSVLAVATGFLSDRLFGHMSLPFPFFTTHGAIQISASLIFLGLLFWRYSSGGEIPNEKGRSLYLAISGAAVGFLFYGAHLGAQLSGRI